VQAVVTIADDLESARWVTEAADWDPRVYAAVALHPTRANALTVEAKTVIERLAEHPRVVAIGETGLDYFYAHSPRDTQKAAFARFLELAHAAGKPVVCHIRDAHADARASLRAGQVTDCVIHCFTGTPDDARAYAELGFYVSFSGIVTYKNAQDLRDAVPCVPRDRLLIETDCPYLAPIPKRGKRNEPSFITHTAEVVARCAGMNFEELAEVTTANACRVFRLPHPGDEP